MGWPLPFLPQIPQHRGRQPVCHRAGLPPAQPHVPGASPTVADNPGAELLDAPARGVPFFQQAELVRDLRSGSEG